MFNTRFLLFRGSLQNEGNLWALESNETIIIAAAGVDNPQVTNKSSFTNIDYLREHSVKIKAIFINNLLPKNSGLLEWVYQELDLKVPVYASRLTKAILQNYYNYDSVITESVVETEGLMRDVKVGDFLLSFFQLDSYLVGNLAVAIYNQEEVFYYLEDFSFNVLSNSSLLFKPFFFQKFRKFLALRRKRTYLIVGCQNLK